MQVKHVYTNKDVILAKKRCASVLKKHSKMAKVQRSCQISILIPVYDESIKRIDKQIKEFSKQSLSKKMFELVYIVNNPARDGSTERDKVILQNSKVIKFLKKETHVTIRLIDLSSNGKALKICNVGIARNFGLHSITQRYMEQGRDGIIINTDADTFPNDADYLNKVYTAFTDPGVFGAAGGVEFVMDIDSYNPVERSFFRKHIQVFRDYTEWHFLVIALQKKRLPKVVASPTRFFGAHMITRGIAGVLAGGIPENGRGEDAEFGTRLELFAEKHNGKILAKWNEWIMDTAFRESRRTGASFGPVFENIRKHHGEPLVRAKDAPHFFHDYLPTLMKKVARTKGDEKALTRLFGSIYGNASKGTKEVIASFAKKLPMKPTKTESHHLYGAMKEQFSQYRPDLVFYSKYKQEYPLVHLTARRLNSLRKAVYKDPKKKEYAEFAVRTFGQWKLPDEKRRR